MRHGTVFAFTKDETVQDTENTPVHSSIASCGWSDKLSSLVSPGMPVTGRTQTPTRSISKGAFAMRRSSTTGSTDNVTGSTTASCVQLTQRACRSMCPSADTVTQTWSGGTNIQTDTKAQGVRRCESRKFPRQIAEPRDRFTRRLVDRTTNTEP